MTSGYTFPMPTGYVGGLLLIPTGEGGSAGGNVGGIAVSQTLPSQQGEGRITKKQTSVKAGRTPLLPWDFTTKDFVESGIHDFAISGSADLGTSCEADAFTVGGTSGADFNGAVTNITVVKGIITAAS